MNYTINCIYDPATFTLTSNQPVVTVPAGDNVTVTITLALPTGCPGAMTFASPPLTWVGTVEPPDYQLNTPTTNPPTVSFTFSNPSQTNPTVFSFLINAVYTNDGIVGDPTIVNDGTGG